MNWIKRIFFYFLCVSIPFIFIEIISGYFIITFYPHQKFDELSKLKSIAASQILFKKIFIRHEHNQFIGNKFILNNGDYGKTLNDESMREVLEKIFIDKSIEKIRSDMHSYHSQIFSFKPNTLNYLMTLNPNVKKSDGVIMFGERGDRKGTLNSSKNECWVFGGSTVWGDRVHGSETITSYLNLLQNKYAFLNYGIPGYNSNSQLNYFIFLLKTREVVPKCVVWLDGLNDGNYIWLRPAVTASDRTSYDDRPPSRILNLSIESSAFLPQRVIQRDHELMEKLTQLQKFDLITFNEVNTKAQEFLLGDIQILSGEEIIFNEAAINHVNNAILARAILEKLSGGNSSFYWFIQPNGELNKENPFFLKDHYKSNRYLINKYYQEKLVTASKGIAISLTNFERDCKFCYVDEHHYSPTFSKKIASEILKSIK